MTGCLSCGTKKILPGGPTPPKSTAAAVQNVIASPEYVNLYWDDTWDLDDANLTMGSFDAFMQAIVGSAFFTNLNQYGVTHASYGGGFVPAAGCPQKPPAFVSFYDPVNPSIVGFLNCELQQGNLPQGSQVIYNILLPAFSHEAEAGNLVVFCQNGGTGWHFHDTPYSAQGATALSAAILGAGISTGPISFLGTSLQTSAVSLLAYEALLALQQGPVYTITSANGDCQTLTDNLLHEMIEAATDPFPQITSFTSEIADLCEDQPAVPAFIPPITSIPITSSGTTLHSPFVTATGIPANSNILAPLYWSSLRQKCESGFENPTTPTNIQVQAAGQGPNLSLTITGSGFGKLPASALGADVSNPYFALQDQTQPAFTPNWQAGNSLNEDLFGVGITAWGDSQIKVQGIASVGTDFTMQSSDFVQLWICNPTWGTCGSSVVNLAGGPTQPNLAISLSVVDPQQNVPYVTVSLDRKGLGSLGNGQTTGWIPVTVGSHTIAAKTTGNYQFLYGGDCSAAGAISLSDGQNLNCAVTAINNTMIDNSGCQTGMHCCGSSKGKCLQCVSNTAFPDNSCP
jgi:hypothetical protein